MFHLLKTTLKSATKGQLKPRYMTVKSLSLQNNANLSIINKLIKDKLTKRRMRKMTEDMQYNFYSIAKFITDDNPYVIEQSAKIKELEKKSNIADELFYSTEYQKALETLRSMIYSAKQIYKEDDPVIGEYLKRVGDVYYEVKELDHAINNYEQSLEILVKGLGESDDRVGRGYFILGNCYRDVENYEESVKLHKKALKVYKEVYGKESKVNVIASCYTSLGEGYIKLGNYKEALNCYEKLFSQLKELYKGDAMYNNNDIYLNQYYLNYGLALAKGKGEYEKGVNYIRRFIESQNKFNGMESLDTALGYLWIGEIRNMQGKHREGMALCEKALQLSREIGGEDHKQVKLCYRMLDRMESGKENSINSFELV